MLLEKDSLRLKTEKLKWHSRRSMLELDLYFDRFIQEGNLKLLSNEELDAYASLLELDDSELLLLFQGEIVAENDKIQNIVNYIKNNWRKLCQVQKQ